MLSTALEDLARGFPLSIGQKDTPLRAYRTKAFNQSCSVIKPETDGINRKVGVEQRNQTRRTVEYSLVNALELEILDEKVGVVEDRVAVVPVVVGRVPVALADHEHEVDEGAARYVEAVAEAQVVVHQHA